MARGCAVAGRGSCALGRGPGWGRAPGQPARGCHLSRRTTSVSVSVLLYAYASVSVGSRAAASSKP
eukprot:scaffold3919_cov59-Phaeocystis_antarctica.AAC.3